MCLTYLNYQLRAPGVHQRLNTGGILMRRLLIRGIFCHITAGQQDSSELGQVLKAKIVTLVESLKNLR